jgi:biotin synthase
MGIGMNSAPPGPGALHPAVRAALEAVAEGRIPGPEAVRRLADTRIPLPDVLRGADSLRVRFSGDRADLCAIVNAKSGACGEDCRFCSQSAKYSANVPAYPLLPPERLLEAARKAAPLGALRIGIVTSGNALSERDFAGVCRSIETLSALSPIPFCASLGALIPARARSLRSAGLRRYHHNVETSRRRFPSLCSTHSWEQRVETIRNAAGADLEVCAGGIFGAGEDWGDRADMALELRELAPASVPLNFLMAAAGTPLQDEPPLPPEDILRTVALFRFAMPDRDIRFAAGRAHLGDRRDLIFQAGANGLMIGDFLTKPGIDPMEDRKLLDKLGLRIGPAR